MSELRLRSPLRGPFQGGMNDNPTEGGQFFLLSVFEAAKALRISQRKLWQLTHDEHLPCVRIGRRVLYDPQDLLSWIDGRKGGAQ